MNDEIAEQNEPIVCPSCHSGAWHCYNETTSPCWNAFDESCGDVVRGYLVCHDCGQHWVDEQFYTSDDPKCWCEED